MANPGDSAEGKYVYVMKDGNNYKVGQSTDAGGRLHQVKHDQGHQNAELVGKFPVKDGPAGETAGQRAVSDQLGMTRVGESDWFRNPNECGKNTVFDTVKSAAEKM